MSAVEILRTGMVTGVGLSAPAACAAIRCGIAAFEETRFMFDGEWLLCAEPSGSVILLPHGGRSTLCAVRAEEAPFKVAQDSLTLRRAVPN